MLLLALTRSELIIHTPKNGRAMNPFAVSHATDATNVIEIKIQTQSLLVPFGRHFDQEEANAI